MYIRHFLRYLSSVVYMCVCQYLLVPIPGGLHTTYGLVGCGCKSEKFQVTWKFLITAMNASVVCSNYVQASPGYQQTGIIQLDQVMPKYEQSFTPEEAATRIR